MTAYWNSRLPAFFCVLLLSACATVDFDYPRDESHAITSFESSETSLGRYAIDLLEDKPKDESGFHLLPNAIDALAIRLLLAERAEKTLDAQYYLVKPDDAGTAFIRALLAAADRGVRVRLLIDDMFTGGKDLGLAALDAHPNLEIRVFNPFASRSLRFIDGITDLSRVNRRMHNKSFTVDNQITIIGGRNIADEYFGSRLDARFGDLDVLSVGPVVEEVSDSFDLYWNHERALPPEAFARLEPDNELTLETVRSNLEEARQAVSGGVYAQAVRASAETMLAMSQDLYFWAPYELAVDSPEKTYKKQAVEAATMKRSLSASLASAEQQIILISPYFVPMKSGVESLLRLEARGIDVTVVTNSLSANNQFTVHGGYMGSRKPLLKGGVEIYEIRRDAHFSGQELVAASGAKSTLHTKAFVVDDKVLFVGSFNFDPRSANINTEMGVIIESPELVDLVTRGIDDALSQTAWKVTLDDRGKLVWQTRDENGQNITVHKEPQTSWWDRLLASIVRVMPVHSQL